MFEIENHGAQHLPAIDVPMQLFGLKAAGSADAIKTEIEGSETAVNEVFNTKPTWYRGAGAQYTEASLALVRTLNFKPAGFSILGDGGALWSSVHAAKAIAEAKDGDVIIAHINQPAKPAGAGVVEGILKLRANGFTFVTLNEGF